MAPPHTPTVKTQPSKSQPSKSQQSSSPSPTTPKRSSGAGLKNRQSSKKSESSNDNKKHVGTEVLDSLKEITDGKGYFPTNFRPGINPAVYRNPLLSKSVSTVLSFTSVVLHFYALYYLSEVYEEIKDKPDAEVPDYVVYAIPLFLISISTEICYDYFFQLGLYRKNDAISSISSGSVQTLSHKLAAQVFGLMPYVWVYENYGIRHPLFQSGPIAWWSLFLGVDFCYYWVHRTGHTMNLFWAMHGVHHASEEYNLTSALRQSVLHGWLNWAFYIPLAFFYPPKLFLLHSQFNLLYQFWIHTQTIRKMGPLEYILNTPSQHRVHHGRNAYCIDKNYGGTLCIFDRLFGTFQDEIEEIPICYGLTHSLHTFDPIAANYKLLANIWESMKKISNPFKKLFACWYGPGWIPGTFPPKEFPIPPCTRHTHHKYNTQLSAGLSRYIVLEFLVCLIFSTLVLAYPSNGPHILFVSVFNVYILFSLYSFGCLSDRAPGALVIELTRLSLGVVFLWYAQTLFQDDISLWRTLGTIAFVVSGYAIYQFREELRMPWKKVELGFDDNDSAVEEAKQIKEAKRQ
eukprot:TRINITY_DN3994_c0_g2_i1.p1 TRINITY_DN3994_c0_g2~~TRINITY_DN3994_c0_g2_i1.p1  ORF type:complete len:572 (+),score=91.36 TRINITY_DN3994_c0_g2_i1:58-1773(+)